MLKSRVIPILLHRGAQLVKGKMFQSWRVVGHAAQAARIHQARNVDELVMLDVGATPEGRGPDVAFTRALSDGCFMPLAIGGGITTLEQIRDLLANGADKVVIGTAAFHDLDFVYQASRRFGAQAIIVAIDYMDDVVWTRCGQHETNTSVTAHAQAVASAGAGEILLTHIAAEGLMAGYSLDMIKKVSDTVDIPIIASGGAGLYTHMADALQSGAHAVSAGAMFQFTDATPLGAAKFLREQGFNTRIAA